MQLNVQSLKGCRRLGCLPATGKEACQRQRVSVRVSQDSKKSNVISWAIRILARRLGAGLVEEKRPRCAAGPSSMAGPDLLMGSLGEARRDLGARGWERRQNARGVSLKSRCQLDN